MKSDFRIFDGENYVFVCSKHLNFQMKSMAIKHDLRESEISYDAYGGAEQCENCPDANERGFFNQLKNVPAEVQTLVDEAESAGAFERGIASNKRGRGTSINVDVYGYDLHQGLAVIQVRQCQFGRKYNSVRKDYFLIGRNENGNVFAHPVESPARSKNALDSAEGCVKWTLCKVWGCTENQLAGIIRQGDVAFIPAALPYDALCYRGTIGEATGIEKFLINDTHLLEARKAYLSNDGRVFVQGEAKLYHTKNQHEIVKTGKLRTYRVAVGNRAPTWSFSSPTVD